MLFKNLFQKNRLNCPARFKRYRGTQFELCYPDFWETSNENGILNFYPPDEEDAITISSYNPIPFRWSEMKKAMLEMNQCHGDPENVKMVEKYDHVEYTFEYLEDNNKWYVKGIR